MMMMMMMTAADAGGRHAHQLIDDACIYTIMILSAVHDEEEAVESDIGG